MARDDTEYERRTFLKATGAAGAAVALGGVASGSTESGDVTQFVVGVSVPEQVQSVAERLPDHVDALSYDADLGFIVVEIESAGGVSTESVTAQVATMSDVKYVERNATYETFDAPRDPKFSDQYAPQQVNAPDAWDTTQGSDDVTIAVIDQGVMYDHPDLTDRFGEDKGYDFVDDDDDPYLDNKSDEYHGTHVAGIASATTDNGKGVAGISDSTILSCRALSEKGKGSLSDIAEAIKWATDQGADVINMSLGGGGYTDTMKNAVTYAVNNGTLPVCAAGNAGESEVAYPAAYEECVAVSALDDNENIADFSNTGDAIDLAAPGVDVLSCWTGSWWQDYNRISGTSMACPVVSGVAGLVAATDPDLGPDGIRARLKNTAVDVGLSEAEQGAGRVDAARAVAESGGGDGGSCGDTYDKTEQSGNLYSGAGDTYSYSPVTDDPCQVSISLSTEAEDVDFDLFATLDGRDPTRDDHDLKSAGSGPDERIVVDGSKLDASTELGILAASYRGSADYTLTVEEWGTVTNEGPTARASVSNDSVDEGEQVVFDAADSTDRDGAIESFRWKMGDGTTLDGESVAHRFSSGGTYEVTLTVTDDAGATDTDTVTVDVEENWWPVW